MRAHRVVGLLAALALPAVTAAPSAATQFRSGEVITILGDEVVNDDLMVAGRSVRVEGTVRGDLLVAANSVTVPGRVEGNVMALAQSVLVPGVIQGSLRTAAQNITLAGPVGRNAAVAGQNVLVERDARIGRDLDVAARSVNLDGAVDGRAAINANTARVAGTTDGQLRFNGQSLQVGPAARIGGDLVVRSPENARIASGAVIAGQIRRLPPTEARARGRGPGIGAGWGLFGNLLFAFALFIVGVVGLALAPRYLRTAADELREKPGWSILWGILLFIVVPIAALLVSFTIIGLPLGLLAWAVWGFAVLFSAIPVAIWIGRETTRWLRHGTPLSAVANLAIGLFLLAVAWTIPILSLIVRLAVVFLGVGMFALAARDLVEHRRAEPARA